MVQQQQVVTEKFDGVKVFSATMLREREMLGEKVTEWMQGHPENKVVSTVVAQSSDSEFHCVTIVVFYARTKKN